MEPGVCVVRGFSLYGAPYKYMFVEARTSNTARLSKFHVAVILFLD